MWGLAVALFLIAVTLGYFYTKKKHSYWSSRGVPVPPYLPFLGHLYHMFFKGRGWERADEIYKKYEDERFWGMYEGIKPSLAVKDPELIKDIYVKDADHFVDRRSLEFPKKDKLWREMLGVLKGEEWKSLRSLMTPTFTAGKIKGMFPLIQSVGDDLITKCNKELLKKNSIDMISVFREYTMDVIISCGFGIQANCLLGEKSQFSDACKELISAAVSIRGVLKFVLMLVSPRIFEALGLQFTTKGMKFLEEAVERTIKERTESGKRRGDFLDIMMDALEEHKKDEHQHKYPMTHTTIISESLFFVMAGFDTTASALSFTTHLLAQNPECQTKLRKELQKIYETDDGFTYQNIMEAQYLDACFSESLRLYPVAHFVERVCTREYRLPGTEIDVEVSTTVGIPVWSIHRDPKYWNEPMKYDPDRFLPENKQNIVPYTYMPFGLGPRNCIGCRFAMLEAKVALAKLCTNFEFSLKPGFEEIVLDTSPHALRPGKDGLPLILNKIN